MVLIVKSIEIFGATRIYYVYINIISGKLTIITKLWVSSKQFCMCWCRPASFEEKEYFRHFVKLLYHPYHPNKTWSSFFENDRNINRSTKLLWVYKSSVKIYCNAIARQFSSIHWYSCKTSWEFWDITTYQFYAQFFNSWFTVQSLQWPRKLVGLYVSYWFLKHFYYFFSSKHVHVFATVLLVKGIDHPRVRI